MYGDGRGRELKAFLRAMRARLAPEDVGLPPLERRRRTPGLRIEEAASLAGVSLTWYSALEAGKDIRVSTNLLERVATSLRLSVDEREHLFALAAHQPRTRTSEIGKDQTLQAIVDGFTTGPAFVCDRCWSVLLFNRLADAVYGFGSAKEKNLLVRMLLEPKLRALHEDWERIARQMVGIFHLSFGRAPDDPDAIALLARLQKQSPAFHAWWNEYGVRRFEPTAAVLQHPTLGRLALTFTAFIASADSTSDAALTIVLQPAADQETLKRLQGHLIATVERRRNSPNNRA